MTIHIVLLCATRRGLRCLEALVDLAPTDTITVFSFPEHAGEPRFLDDIRSTALARGARFIQAQAVGGSSAAPFWTEAPVDLLLAVSWRYIVPPEILRRPTRGAYVFHDSLLPRHRGFAPTIWAMVDGEDHTGVTLFEMEPSVDTGAIVDQVRVPIGPEEPIASVLERTTQAYVEVLTRNLPALRSGEVVARPQDETAATYGRRRTPDDDRIDWALPGARIYDLIRAVGMPYPGAFTWFDGQQVRVWVAERPTLGGDAGRNLASPGTLVGIHPGVGVEIATGDGTLLVTMAQIGDGRPTRGDRLWERPGATLGG